MKVDYQPLLAKIDYQFSNLSLLQQALTHRSYGPNNNERLEFLGDSLLSSVTSEWLFTHLQKASEGDLSRIRANLVCGKSLAVIAKRLDLGPFLRLGAGEMKSAGHQRESILADAVEAIIAAVYLDSGYEQCRQVVLGLIADRLDVDSLIKESKDPKTRLQELLQAQKLPLPQYEVCDVSGKEHAQIFHVSCEVSGIANKSQGKGSSRRKAEQSAAENFIKLLEHDD